MLQHPPGTSVTRTDGSPFFPSFQKEMSRLFDQFRSGFPMPDANGASWFTGEAFPAIDVVETDKTLTITAEVPGVKEDDLDVSISGDVLTLKGTKSSDHEEVDDNYHLIERRYGSFQRQIPLGFTPEDDAVDVEFSDGVLKLSLGMPDAAKPDVHKIKIQKTKSKAAR